MKRIGERGDGTFERISWDEALDTIVSELNRVKSTYGPSAVCFPGVASDHTYLHRGNSLIGELLKMTGGYTARWGSQSFEAALFARVATFGTLASRNYADDFLNSRLIIMWAWDPLNTIQETNTSWYLLKAKEKGTKFISVDPRHTSSTAVLADQWIPIRPGTDTAMLIAMAYVMIKQNLHDQTFLDKYTVGFNVFKDYVLGLEDTIPKTPTWAEGICGVPAAAIENLAMEYATTKPAALIAGMAPGRTAYGEQYHRAAKTLTAMTGNIGIHGGSAANSYAPGSHFGSFDFKLSGLPKSEVNPVEFGIPPRKDSLETSPGSHSGARIHYAELADTILKGKAHGYQSDIKMLIAMHTNPINQCPNTNKMTAAFKKLEFITVAEQVMTATAKFADILLPVSTNMERNDITAEGAVPWCGYVNKVIEPLYESRSPFEICKGLASRLGVSVFSEKTEEEWLRDMIKGSYVPDYDILKETACYRLRFSEPHVAFKKQIEDLENNPFPTPSGRIEIYSQRLADMNNPEIPPIPKYIEHWEGRNDPLAAKYPLQLVTTHFKRRAHSQFESVPWLRELMPQALLINTVDAQARDINSSCEVRVFNDRGVVIIPAIVTERILPGVVDMPQGAWYNPDEHGIDRGGCCNVLTKDVRSPGGAYCFNTALVQVQKV